MANQGFTAAVRAAMKQGLPGYRFDHTHKGSGPIVSFTPPVTQKRIAQTVFIQKGLYGATWLRANFAATFVDRGKREHELDHAALPDIDYETGDDLVARLTTLIPALDKAVKRQAARVAKDVPRLAGLFDRIEGHAARWMREAGNALPAGDFHDESDFAERAYDRFLAWLGRENLRVRSADLAVWHWWTDHHPRPKSTLKPKPKPQQKRG
jgi:hypothetical protein